MYDFKIWCGISKVPFEISHQILKTYTAKYAFYAVLKVIVISSSCDILRRSETGWLVVNCAPSIHSFCLRTQISLTLRWRHNDHAGVSNHQPHGCLLNRLFRRKSKKTSKLRVTGLCAGNSPGTGEFPAQMASYAENVSIWWRHHEQLWELLGRGIVTDRSR